MIKDFRDWKSERVNENSFMRGLGSGIGFALGKFFAAITLGGLLTRGISNIFGIKTKILSFLSTKYEKEIQIGLKRQQSGKFSVDEKFSTDTQTKSFSRGNFDSKEKIINALSDAGIPASDKFPLSDGELIQLKKKLTSKFPEEKSTKIFNLIFSENEKLTKKTVTDTSREYKNSVETTVENFIKNYCDVYKLKVIEIKAQSLILNSEKKPVDRLKEYWESEKFNVLSSNLKKIMTQSKDLSTVNSMINSFDSPEEKKYERDFTKNFPIEEVIEQAKSEIVAKESKPVKPQPSNNAGIQKTGFDPIPEVLYSMTLKLGNQSTETITAVFIKEDFGRKWFKLFEVLEKEGSGYSFFNNIISKSDKGIYFGIKNQEKDGVSKTTLSYFIGKGELNYRMEAKSKSGNAELIIKDSEHSKSDLYNQILGSVDLRVKIINLDFMGNETSEPVKVQINSYDEINIRAWKANLIKLEKYKESKDKSKIKSGK